MLDLDGQSKGFGFITFDKLEDAQKAVQTMNGQKVLGKSIGFY
jgi:polyadenylate-binding protein